MSGAGREKRGSFALLRIVSWIWVRLFVRPDEGGAVIRVATRITARTGRSSQDRVKRPSSSGPPVRSLASA